MAVFCVHAENYCHVMEIWGSAPPGHPKSPCASQSFIFLSRDPVAMNSAVPLAGGDFFSPAKAVQCWYDVGGANSQHRFAS